VPYNVITRIKAVFISTLTGLLVTVICGPTLATYEAKFLRGQLAYEDVTVT
jgi:hypothetical protein